jgi:hypothetical protein
MWFWLFVLSCCINLVALFYVRWLIKTIAVINQDVEALTEMVTDFAAHTKSVYELEMFYGDETLESLMRHATQLSEKLTDLDLVLNGEEEEELGTTEED